MTRLLTNPFSLNCKIMDIFTFVLFLTFISNTVHSLNTTEPATTEMEFTTTQFFTTIELEAEQSILIQVTVKLQSKDIDKDWVKRNERTLIQIMKDSTGVDDGVEVVIGKITEIWEEQNNDRRLLELVLVGVEIEYLIVIDEPGALRVVESSFETASFDEEFQQGIDETFTEVEIVVEETTFENKGVGDADEFLGKTEPTFAELIYSEYIILGLVCSVAGIVWLIFLQSKLENDYPTYVSLPPNGGRNSVELVQQASTLTDDGNTTK
eukprot:595499_1